jgi:hypothetical protein
MVIFSFESCNTKPKRKMKYKGNLNMCRGEDTPTYDISAILNLNPPYIRYKKYDNISPFPPFQRKTYTTLQQK